MCEIFPIHYIDLLAIYLLVSYFIHIESNISLVCGGWLSDREFLDTEKL